MHMGLSGRGDYVSHHTVYADDFKFCVWTVFILDLFLLVHKVPYISQWHCEGEEHLNAF